MWNGGYCIRGFRPSQFATADDLDPDAEQAKAVNVKLYADRVAAGLPLFESGAATAHEPRESRPHDTA